MAKFSFQVFFIFLKKLKNFKFFFYRFTFPGKLEICLTDFGWEMGFYESIWWPANERWNFRFIISE
jgi:hypothetical protein